MSAPRTALIRRGELLAWLVDSAGIPRKQVEKWLREEVIAPHRFPGLKTQPARRVYCVATVALTLDLPARHDP